VCVSLRGGTSFSAASAGGSILTAMAYTKLFNSIVTSTIWLETDRTRIVWITMLALADQNGEVQASIPGLAHVAGVPVEDCRTALAKFLGPDPDSRTRDDEGQRIEEIEGGWVLLNHGKYRAMASGEDRQQKAAIRQRRFREKKARNPVTLSNAPVTLSNALSHTQSQAEAEAQADGREQRAEQGVSVVATPPTRTPSASNPSLSEWLKKASELYPAWPAADAEGAWHHYEANGWRVGKNPVRKWPACLATCHGHWRKQNADQPATPARLGKNVQ